MSSMCPSRIPTKNLIKIMEHGMWRLPYVFFCVPCRLVSYTCRTRIQESRRCVGKILHISSIAGVMTTCRRSDNGTMMDPSFKRNNAFRLGQQIIYEETGHSLEVYSVKYIVRSTRKSWISLHPTWIPDIVIELLEVAFKRNKYDCKVWASLHPYLLTAW